ncbi:AAA family ATPase [Mucilaginibacter sp. PAMB04274]|uniref:exopolysaccharide transport family protein n=1 Tax=Mucilaginibacter sp. PAMB04274 TaxID=3138568 RepID=UPI0031F67516
MEIRNYFLLLKRHKLMLIIIPVIAMIAAYAFVRYLPDTYVAKTQIITGLIDQSQQVLDNNNRNDNRRNDEFTNLIETMQLDKVMSQVSYQLVIHDLTSGKPFRKMNKAEDFSPAMGKKIVSTLKEKQQSFGLLNPSNPLEKNIDSLTASMGYDAGQLLKKNLKIYHFDGSDFIILECETENAALSAFIINQLSNKFITYYTNYVGQGRYKSTEFLASLLNEKKTAMRAKIDELQNYKIKHNILDMTNEAKDVYGQISSLESYRQQADKDVIAYRGALKSIDGRFNPRDRRYLESTTAKVNSSILSTRERLRVMNNKYLENNFDQRYKKSVDSLQDVLSEQINESTDKYISNPLAAKDNLVQEKLKMENSLELARYSSGSLNRQLSQLKGRLNSLVPAEAVVNSLERDIDVATKEYLDVQDKYNQANVANIMPVQLRQLHSALSGAKQPSKKIFLVAVSGVVSFALCMVIVLLLFYIDDCVRNREDLERITKMPVIGELNLVPEMAGKKIQPKQEKYVSGSITLFRNLLRNIRFEIDRVASKDKIFAITSLNGTQGKTLFSFSLAYAYAISNKKVLLVDGNFSNPLISETAKPKLYLEDYLRGAEFENSTIYTQIADAAESDKLIRLQDIDANNSITTTIQRLSTQTPQIQGGMDRISIIGNRGGDTSLFEISNQSSIRKRLDDLKSKFDVIIIETGSLDTLSKSKEWMQFSDKTIAVFENNQSIKNGAKAGVKYLHSLNGKMLGWVLNKVPVTYKEAVKS